MTGIITKENATNYAFYNTSILGGGGGGSSGGDSSINGNIVCNSISIDEVARFDKTKQLKARILSDLYCDSNIFMKNPEFDETKEESEENPKYYSINNFTNNMNDYVQYIHDLKEKIEITDNKEVLLNKNIQINSPDEKTMKNCSLDEVSKQLSILKTINGFKDNFERYFEFKAGDCYVKQPLSFIGNYFSETKYWTTNKICSVLSAIIDENYKELNRIYTQRQNYLDRKTIPKETRDIELLADDEDEVPKLFNDFYENDYYLNELITSASEVIQYLGKNSILSEALKSKISKTPMNWMILYSIGYSTWYEKFSLTKIEENKLLFEIPETYQYSRFLIYVFDSELHRIEDDISHVQYIFEISKLDNNSYEFHSNINAIIIETEENNFKVRIESDSFQNEINDLTSRCQMYYTYENDSTFSEYFSQFVKKDELDSYFTISPGINNFDIENKYISHKTETINGLECNLLIIDIPEERKQQFLNYHRPIFKIVLRKKVIFDEQGHYFNEFYISTKNNQIHCPVIIYDQLNKYCIITDTTSIVSRAIGDADESFLYNTFYIAFDKRLSIDPYKLYLNGELAIYNQFEPTTLKTDNAIKCSIIEADNALKLHKSDNLYLYKPDIITEDNEYYKMVFKIPSNYEIPDKLEFVFKDYCFLNEWFLRWNSIENQWEGINCLGKLTGKIISKLQKNNSKQNSDGAHGSFILMKDCESNRNLIPNNDKGIFMDFIENSSIKTKIWFSNKKDKSEDGDLYDIKWEFDKKLNGESCEGYDLLNCYFSFGNLSSGKFNYLNLAKVELIITQNGSLTSNTLTFISLGIRRTTKNDRAYIELKPQYDCIEQVAFTWKDSKIEKGNKNIELYFKKNLVQPIEQFDWDSNTNPFQYIIQNQFYEISPRPDAATTLYTDYNITSSKIITADNITTMRSDLNMVSNNVDVINFDMERVKRDVDILNYEMAIQILKTQYLEQEVNKVKIRANVALGFGIAGTFLGATGLLLNPNVIDFGNRAIDQIKKTDISNTIQRWIFGEQDDLQELIYIPKEPNSVPHPPLPGEIIDPSNILIESGGSAQRLIGQSNLDRYMENLRWLVSQTSLPENFPYQDTWMERICNLCGRVIEEFPNITLPEDFFDLYQIGIVGPNVRSVQLGIEDKNKLKPLIDWCDSKNENLLDSSKFEDNWINPEKALPSISVVLEICENYRNSLKFPFKMLAYQILENDYLTKQNDFVKNSEIDSIISNKITEIQPSGESNFTIQPGINDFFIENKYISHKSETINGLECNLLVIDIPNNRKQQFLSFNRPIFKIVLRKNVIYDSNGKYIKEFYISTKNNQILCPVIIYDQLNKYCTINDTTLIATRSIDDADGNSLDGKFYIAFDKRLSIIPYNLYLSGDLSILNQFEPTCLKTDKAIKCSIIEADNALKLHKSDVHYFYKPSIITEDNEFYKMVFSIEDSYEIPDKLEFIFKESCFGNQWSLTWDGTKWNGNNRKGHLNGKVINKINWRPTASKEFKNCCGCAVVVKISDEHVKIIQNNGKGLMESLLTNYVNNCWIEMSDGTRHNGSKFNMTFEHQLPAWSSNGESNSNWLGYHGTYIPYFVLENTSSLRFDLIEKIYIDIYVGESSSATRLSFKPDGVKHEEKGKKYLDIVPVNDTIEMISYDWGDSNIDTTKKDIELYLKKELTNSIDEVNWDSKTNAFKYIIDQQFYEISPNPNAATTLYTDFNITSSKIITADNITTMRSDLNVLTNNFDVVSYDVKDITEKVDVLNAEMSETKRITKHLQEDIDETRMIADVALAVGVASMCTQIGSTGISFITNTGKSMLQSCAAAPLEYEMTTTSISILPSIPVGYSLRSPSIDLTPLKNWYNSEYQQIPEIKYEEYQNNSTTATSLITTFDICNHFRHSMKPAFKMLTEKIEEIDNNDYIKKSDLIRSDTIDIITHYQDEQAAVLFQAEDELINGICVFKLFTSEGQKQLYFKIEEGEIIEYKGVDTTTTIDDITLDGKEKSEEYRTKYLSKINKIDKNVIITGDNQNYKIVGCIIEKNTFIRILLEKTPSDIAYLSDIEALNEKINSLAVNSHTNDAVMTASLNDFPTIDEVNSALEQLKETMIDKENLYTSDKIILDSEGFISFDTTLNDSNDETIMTSKSTSKLLKAINSYLNKKFVDFYDAIDDHDIWISEAEGKYALKTDILSTENITQELSIATKFVNGTTNDEDKRTYITNLDSDLCNILKKSSLFVKGSCNNEDISGEYLYDGEDAEYFHYKKGENTFSLSFFYYGGTFKYNDNYVVDLESVSCSYKPEVYDEYCIPNMNLIKNNYALKSDIPLVVQSDETECDATAAVPSLDYVVNTYQTIFESNLIDKKANLLEKQLTAIDNKFSNYALKSETDTKLTQLDNYYDSLVEQLDSTYYDKVDCDEKFALKSNVITEEQLIKKCAIDCGPFSEGADISIHLLKIINNTIQLEYVVGNNAERNEIRILFYDTAANPHNIVILLYQRTIYFDNFQYSAYYEEILDLSSGRPLTYRVPMAGYNWTTTQELLDARQIYSRQIMVPGYLAKFKAAIYGTQSNTTITHYAPIEDIIDDFEIGKPVFITGKVYKRIDNQWIESIEKDSTDCICSVKTTGIWKEFIGICVRIDERNNSITFASHGDYLVKVDDSSSFEIGDEIYIDEDNQFKVLDENTPITSKIRRLTIGIITSKINNNIVSVFKE
ncbi:hypothetical protein M9Y10_035479 [Tritrichomonas musculus]|uniref:Uncharacterized protein n=1 Tax=Tritrichomonas musculus TaxID=1915356 RepID=A0ABR2KHT6_9EUKA